MTYTRAARLTAAVGSVAALLVTGCQTWPSSTTATLIPEPTQTPVFADTTQPVRDYPQSVSYIQNGDTVNDGSVGFRYRSSDNINVGLEPVAEVGVFAANIVTLPYTFWQQRGEQISTGLQFPPTYTANPPLPPEQPAVASAPQQEVEQQQNQVSSPTQVTTPSVDTTAPATQPTDAGMVTPQTDAVLLAPTTQAGGASFTIAGQVLKPGTYDATNLKLSQVVAAAGPSTEDKTKVRVQIDRPGEESAITTLDQLLNGSMEDVSVKSGDVITISVLP